MARLSGKNLVVTFAGVTISGTQRTFEFEHEEEQIDASAGADTYRTFIPSMRVINPKMEAIMEDKASGSAVQNVLDIGQEGTLVWSPEGTASGKPRWGITARVSKAAQTMPFDDVHGISVEWVNTSQALVYDGSTAVH